MNLVGLHDREALAMAPPDTWILDTIALAEYPQPHSYAESINWITRCNWGYGRTGTLPAPDYYDEYVKRLVAYVRGSRGCSRWIVGNEPNLPREWPDGKAIWPGHYADCYLRARAAIHSIPGHGDDEVLIAAPGPWNAEFTYPTNRDGDWIDYFADVLTVCDPDIDGFALHAYTHGYDPNLVASEAKMDDPFDDLHYEFRTYRDYCRAIPAWLHDRPVYITEANGNGPWQAKALMPAMADEIHAWNQTHTPKICSLIFYRYPRYDEFSIEGNRFVIDEYMYTVSLNYPSPAPVAASKPPVTTHLPHIVQRPEQTAGEIPMPREIDPRLAARGMTITEAQIPAGSPYWRLVKAKWFDEQESGGRHHIYVEALNEKGDPVDAVPFLVNWSTGSQPGYTRLARGFEAANFPMSTGRNAFAVRITGSHSDQVEGVGMGADTPGGFNAGIHTSTLLTFQRTTPQALGGSTEEPGATIPAKLIHPVADTRYRAVTQAWGVNGEYYKQFSVDGVPLRGHNGLDFGTPIGTPIVAVDGGAVVEVATDNSGYGEYIKLRHSWGESLYAHLDTQYVTVGANVLPGEIIGSSGNTGNSTGPHLHFGLRVAPFNRRDGMGGYTDPSPYLGLAAVPEEKPVKIEIINLLAAVKEAAQEFGLEWQLVASLVQAESSFNPKAQSKAGAKGLMQLMDPTWKEWAEKVGGSDVFHPVQNLRVGCAYLAWLLRYYKNNTYEAIVAYNFGVGNVDANRAVPDDTVAYAERVLFGRELLRRVGA